MSSLRDMARQRLREMGQAVGQGAGQGPETVVPHPSIRPAPVGQDFPQNSADNDVCPIVPRPRDRDSGTSTPKAGTSGGTKRGTDPRIVSAIQREWRANLAKLDRLNPVSGYDRGRWQILYDDACWVFNDFGEQAARNGWTSADLFGRWPHIDGWGGIADRLRGSRSLKISADVATWRWGDQPQKYPRGVYPDLQPFWEKCDG